MDYEKLYKVALEKARVWKEKSGMPTDRKGILDDIFPELKESEDERIRKAQLNYWRSVGGKEWHGVPVQETITWLEKQSEQKTADKIEHKFHEGDWCIDNEDNTIFQIAKVLDNTYTYKTNEGKEYFCSHYSLENDARLWTIQDAKAGDVLANNKGCIFINASPYNESRATLDCYCYVSVQGEFCVEEYKTGSWLYVSELHPATKEQRDLLFQKMEEAGYEWDADKLELRKIEQKAIEPKHKIGDTIYYNSFGEVKSMIVDNIVDDGDGNPMYEDVNENAVFEKDLIEQKLAEWGEKDDKNLNNILYILNQLKDTTHNDEIDTATECINWLKSIKSYKINYDKGFKDGVSAEKFNRWKPSDKQIQLLEEASKYVYKEDDIKLLKSLCQDLQKLKG